jgi:hypothetical protein
MSSRESVYQITVMEQKVTSDYFVYTYLLLPSKTKNGSYSGRDYSLFICLSHKSAWLKREKLSYFNYTRGKIVFLLS